VRDSLRHPLVHLAGAVARVEGVTLLLGLVVVVGAFALGVVSYGYYRHAQDFQQLGGELRAAQFRACLDQNEVRRNSNDQVRVPLKRVMLVAADVLRTAAEDPNQSAATRQARIDASNAMYRDAVSVRPLPLLDCDRLVP